MSAFLVSLNQRSAAPRQSHYLCVSVQQSHREKSIMQHSPAEI